MNRIRWSNFIEAFGPPGVGKTTTAKEVINQTRLDYTLPFSLLSGFEIKKNIIDMYRATLLFEGRESILFPKGTEKLITKAYIKLRKIAYREKKSELLRFTQNVYCDAITDKMEARLAEACLYQEVIKKTGRTNWIISDQSVLHRGLMYASRQRDPEEYLYRFVEYTPVPELCIYCTAPVETIRNHIQERSNHRKETHGASAATTLKYAEILFSLLKKRGFNVLKVSTEEDVKNNAKEIINSVIALCNNQETQNIFA